MILLLMASEAVFFGHFQAFWQQPKAGDDPERGDGHGQRDLDERKTRTEPLVE